MTPEERAKDLIDRMSGDEGCEWIQRSKAGGGRYVFLQPTADAIRAAVLAEREACAALCSIAGTRLPDAAQVRRILEIAAATIRARGSTT